MQGGIAAAHEWSAVLCPSHSLGQSTAPRNTALGTDGEPLQRAATPSASDSDRTPACKPTQPPDNASTSEARPSQVRAHSRSDAVAASGSGSSSGRSTPAPLTPPIAVGSSLHARHASVGTNPASGITQGDVQATPPDSSGEDCQLPVAEPQAAALPRARSPQLGAYSNMQPLSQPTSAPERRCAAAFQQLPAMASSTSRHVSRRRDTTLHNGGSSQMSSSGGSTPSNHVNVSAAHTTQQQHSAIQHAAGASSAAQEERPRLGDLIDGSFLPPEMLDAWDGRDIEEFNTMAVRCFFWSLFAAWSSSRLLLMRKLLILASEFEVVARKSLVL